MFLLNCKLRRSIKTCGIKMLKIGKKIYVSFPRLIELGFDYPKPRTKIIHVDNAILSVVLGPEALEINHYYMVKPCEDKWIDWIEVSRYKNDVELKKPKQEMYVEISPENFIQK